MNPEIGSATHPEGATPQNDRYLAREIKPGLWAIWDWEHRCYWKSSRYRHDIEAMALAYNADWRREAPDIPYGVER